ncbi:MAG: hypothetical protein FWG15_02200 [Propionibacteriaceae bacterium]|nr:hypothetical protein [Propionibacteriaceae bacterium]
MANQIVGVCGFTSSGSSAVTDLLHEFSDAQVLDHCELSFTYYPDGLDDLTWQLTENYGKHFQSLAIERFRRLMSSRAFFRAVDKKTINQLTDQFLDQIVQVKWHGMSAHERDRLSFFLRRGSVLAMQKAMRAIRIAHAPRVFFSMVGSRIELTARPENIYSAAQEFVTNVLAALGRDTEKITILNQPFCGNNPVKSFRYFGAPKAIIIDRDPRDLYLFCKHHLRRRGEGMQIAMTSVEDFIAWFRTTRVQPDGLRERDDVMFIRFEELLYDYDNAISKISAFTGVKTHVAKGKYFKPNWSRSNSQLFRNYPKNAEEIKVIEGELPEFLFPFDEYPDIPAHGEMFFGSQAKRR